MLHFENKLKQAQKMEKFGYFKWRKEANQVGEDKMFHQEPEQNTTLSDPLSKF